MSARFRLALTRALLCGLVLPSAAVFAAPPAAVAQATQPDRTVFALRFAGEWRDNSGFTYNFTREGVGNLKGVVTRSSTGEQVAVITWAPHGGGMGGNFTSAEEPLGGITGYVDHQGGAHLFVRAGRFPNGGTPAAGNFRLSRPAAHPPAKGADLWTGTWRTSRGLLKLEREAGHLFGYIEGGDPIARTQRIALDGDGGITVGAWEKYGEWSSTVDRGDVWLQISADEKSFRGYYTDVNNTGARRIDWTGQRVEAQAPQNPTEQSPAAPTADQMQLVRKLEGHWRETASDSQWRFPAPEANGAIRAVTWRTPSEERSGGFPMVFSPAADGRTLTGQATNGNRLIIEPNQLGEVHLIRPAQGNSQFWSTELVKAQAAPAESSPQPAPQPQPQPTQPPPSPAPAPAPTGSAFKPLNRVDVRVDRVIVARGYPTHQVHAFVTVKNTSASPQYFTSGFLKAVLADADGMSWERSQPYRASSEPAELFSSTPVIQPGSELKARFVFLSEDGAHLTSLTLSEGGREAAFPLGGQ